MAMSDEDYRVFESHLIKHRLRKPCPICGTDKWQADGPYVLSMKTAKDADAELEYALVSHLSRTRGLGMGGVKGPQPTLETFTFVLLTCSTCFFVRQFNWLPIKNAGRRG